MSWRDTALTALAIAGLALPARAAGPIVGPIMVSDPIAAPQPRGGATVLSMTVTNNGDVTDHLIRAACPDAGSVTFEAPVQEGSTELHQVEGFEVPARKAIFLKPGGWQITLHDLRRAIAASDVLPCTVTFQLSGEQIVQAGVREGAP
jgi:copper(I)-binding protein